MMSCLCERRRYWLLRTGLRHAPIGCLVSGDAGRIMHIVWFSLQVLTTEVPNGVLAVSDHVHHTCCSVHTVDGNFGPTTELRSP
jgi:hypothetical protein